MPDIDILFGSFYSGTGSNLGCLVLIKSNNRGEMGSLGEEVSKYWHWSVAHV